MDKRATVSEVGQNDDGQRIDNFLIKTLKGVPKSRIYRAIRSGEVRVNGGRIKTDSRIHAGDRVRVPPVRTGKPVKSPGREHGKSWSIPIILEDEDLMIVNKPCGLAVHGGTGHDFGLIEIMQARMDKGAYLQLVHRLDRETSGCLMLAKSRRMLLKLQQDMVSIQRVHKQYLALVKGCPQANAMDIRIALGKTKWTDHRVKPDHEGRTAHSRLNVERRFADAALVRIDLITGRMHQARVHCSEAGFPIAGDNRYGDRDFNRSMKKLGLERLFLHAHKLNVFGLNDLPINVTAPLPEPLEHVLESLEA